MSTVIAEGKTKILYTHETDPNLTVIESKDDITAGDGAKHDIIPGKGRLATLTTSNVFNFLKSAGVPVGFVAQTGERTFVAPQCHMLPYEVVVRREAHGSFLKRYPHLTKGTVFPKLIVEFFLKTKNKQWKNHTLLADDPLMKFSVEEGVIRLYEPGKPFNQEPFLVLKADEVFSTPNEHERYEKMSHIARHSFLLLEKAWELLGRRLVDYKVEFGIDNSGSLLLADVIDNDSWRLIEGDQYIDKQVYRDGGAISDVVERYIRVAELTNHFPILPREQIVLWRGSDKDPIEPFADALRSILGESHHLPLTSVVCSIHKEPARGYLELQKVLQQLPHAVVIAYIGRSNGAGPTLSAVTSVPVITVPASVKEFPQDIWSSLRAPSATPVMTVLEPSNAVLAALQILALKSPSIYAKLKLEQEKRALNLTTI